MTTRPLPSTLEGLMDLLDAQGWGYKVSRTDGELLYRARCGRSDGLGGSDEQRAPTRWAALHAAYLDAQRKRRSRQRKK